MLVDCSGVQLLYDFETFVALVLYCAFSLLLHLSELSVMLAGWQQQQLQQMVVWAANSLALILLELVQFWMLR